MGINPKLSKYAFISRNLLLCTAVLPPLSLSCDHAVVSFEVKLKDRIPNQPEIFRYDYVNADYDTINSQINDYLKMWKFYDCSNQNLQVIYDSFIDFLLKTIDENVPKKSTKSPKFKKAKTYH